MLRFLERGRADKTVVLFAVFDISTGEQRFAGLLKLYKCDLSTLVSHTFISFSLDDNGASAARSS